MQHCNSVQVFMSKMSDQPEELKGRIIFMSMFNDISWRSEDNERECDANADLVSIYATRFPAGRWSFLGLASEKKWYSICIDRPRGEWDRVAESMMNQIRRKRTPSFPRHESTIPRHAQKQGRWKVIGTLLCRWGYD